ncbi:hypothetical protein GCM10023201_38450 [Actinomycetospora corticicola]|uniref:Uncharacterized protein n=1 Tax=Actinomycetospora corticicola TaxID=663602 RepID=A0A7Y9DYY4_9PSEU|nr:hypothetical protein [Actinomycetospora corticicola]NYD38051.1 hypothetical protein [Actinomycetospora corticicola]
MRRVEIGVVVLAVLGLVDAVSPWLLPAPPDAPPFVDAVSLVLGVLTLVLLAVWWARRSRAALWAAVVIRAVSALLAVPAWLSGVGGGLALVLAVAFVVTVIGIVLVAPALGRSRAGRAPASA